MDKDAFRLAVEDVLEEMDSFLGQGGKEEISEADTRAYFVDPVITALGWKGIGVVQREYYVRSSQEAIDYVMKAAGSPVLAVEAKRLTAPLLEKHAAQLVQYCSVEGIEWAALTNGREWQVFNAYVQPGLSAKRLFQFDLLAHRQDGRYPDLVELLWLLAREQFPSPIRAWLERHRLDSALRKALAESDSKTIRAVLQDLQARGVSTTKEHVVNWFREYVLQPERKPLQLLATDDPGQIADQPARTAESVAPSPSASTTRPAASNSGTTMQTATRSKHYYGVRLEELVRTHLLRPGTSLALMAHSQVIATGEIGPDGKIVFKGKTYANPSHADFARVLGRTASNGWTDWHAVLPEGRVSLSDLRDRYLHARKPTSHGVEQTLGGKVAQ